MYKMSKIKIRQVFSNITPSNWKVIDIQITDDTSSKKLLCEIYLSAIKYTPSSIAAKHGSNGSKLLLGRLVECDFGFFSQDYCSGKVPATTIRVEQRRFSTSYTNKQNL